MEGKTVYVVTIFGCNSLPNDMWIPKNWVFEEYDIPSMGLKTVNGIAEMGEMKGAWFKDSEGNILAVSNM